MSRDSLLLVAALGIIDGDRGGRLRNRSSSPSVTARHSEPLPAATAIPATFPYMEWPALSPYLLSSRPLSLLSLG